jgi:D-ribulokinase
VLERPVRLVAQAEAGLGMAILAASGAAGGVGAAADAMVHPDDEIVPRADRAGRFRAPYLRLVDELEGRGWLREDVAAHARRRAEA